MIAVPLQLSVRTSTVLAGAAEIGGLAVLAAAVAGAAAIAYRWYARERVSNPPAVLIALATVAFFLHAMTALGQVMDGADPLTVRAAAFNVSALAVGTVAAMLGIAVGDHLARTVLGGTEQVALDDSVSRVVRAVGRVITVELPAEIDDVPGYDPVDADTKAALEGKTFVFPRGLTVDALRDRLTRRLREDYRVGHVDIEIGEDGTVTHLGLGARAAGLGPTLPPESAAMAIRADPAYAASAGDLVQVWERGPKRRLLNAEVRGTAGDVVTLAIDAADASKLSTDDRYKLATLPVEERADRELTELLRAAEETLGVVEIADGSPLAGVPVGALEATVIAIHAGGPNDHIETLPATDRVISGGDSVYVIARPDAIRRIEAAGTSDGGGEHASSTISEDGAGNVNQAVDTGRAGQAVAAGGEDEQAHASGEEQTVDTGRETPESDPTEVGQADTERAVHDADTDGEDISDETADEGEAVATEGEGIPNGTDGENEVDDGEQESRKEDTDGDDPEADDSAEPSDNGSVDRSPE